MILLTSKKINHLMIILDIQGTLSFYKSNKGPKSTSDQLLLHWSTCHKMHTHRNIFMLLLTYAQIKIDRLDHAIDSKSFLPLLKRS